MRGKTYVFEQSHIDQSVWNVVSGHWASEGAGAKHHVAASGDDAAEAVGHIIVYVDDFMIAG